MAPLSCRVWVEPNYERYFPLVISEERHHIPGREGPGAKNAVVGSSHEMAADPKQIVDLRMDGEETLRLPG